MLKQNLKITKPSQLGQMQEVHTYSRALIFKKEEGRKIRCKHLFLQHLRSAFCLVIPQYIRQDLWPCRLHQWEKQLLPRVHILVIPWILAVTCKDRGCRIKGHQNISHCRARMLNLCESVLPLMPDPQLLNSCPWSYVREYRQSLKTHYQIWKCLDG